MTRRQWLVAVGVAASLAGGAMILAPRVTPAVGGALPLLALALGVVLAAGAAAFGGLTTDSAGAAPAPRTTTRPVPGDEFDAALSAVTAAGRRDGSDDRAAVRERLEAAAVALLVERQGCSPAGARDRLAAGAWTDDPAAAAFFREGDTPALSTADHLRVLAGGELPFRRRARRVVAALDALARDAHGASAESVEAGTPTEAAGDDDDGRPSERPVGGAAVTREDWPAVGEGREVATGRWHVVAAVALLGGAVGVLVRSPPAVLVGAFGVVVAAYARATGPPPADLAVERTLSPVDPDPGEAVRVTLSVRNEGATLLPDVAVYDGVPEGVSVVDGSPRLGTALGSGEAATLAYTVRVPPGEQRFAAPLVVSRGIAGAVERSERVRAAGTEGVTATPSLATPADLPLRPRATGRPGAVPLATGGEGVAFHAVRAYRHGDPLARIDWARAARTGELSTVTYRESQAARVVLVIDARTVAYVAPGGAAPTAVARSVEAAGTLAGALLGASTQVGLAALSPRDCWVPPGAGGAHRERLRRRLGGDPALAGSPPTVTAGAAALADRLRTRLSGGTQVVLLSPLVDDGARVAARRLEASGHPVTVVSPDVTTDGTAGRVLAGVERRRRVRALRSAGLRVVDWSADEPLAGALARRGWSR